MSKLCEHALLHCCERPVLRRKAMLGPPLRNGLYCMAWTVLAGWRCFLDFAGVSQPYFQPFVTNLFVGFRWSGTCLSAVCHGLLH